MDGFLNFVKPFRGFQKEWVIIILLVLWVILLRVPSLPQPLDNDSGALAYHARLIVEGEPLYTTHHPGHHMPGPYYTYALVFLIFGYSVLGLKVFLLGWVCITTLFVYHLGKKSGGTLSGVLAGIFFGIISSATVIAGDTGEIENFANLFLTLTVLLVVDFVQKQRRPMTFIVVGVLSAICILFKANYIAPLVSIGLGLLIQAILNRRRDDWIEFLQRGLAIAIGGLLTFGLVLTYFLAVGALPGLKLIILFGSEYIARNASLPLFYIFFIGPILLAKAAPWIVAAGLVFVLVWIVSLPGIYKANRVNGSVYVILVLWLFMSIVEAGTSRLSFSHYSILIIPPISLFAGLGISRIINGLGLDQKKVIWARGFGVVLVFAMVANGFYVSRDYYLGFLDYITGQKTLNQFIIYDTVLGPSSVQAAEVADYIHANTKTGDTTLNWTDEADIYFLSGRRSAAASIWTMYIPALQTPDQIMANSPKYIIVGHRYFQTERQLPIWLVEVLARSYRLETIKYQFFIYRSINS